MPPRRSPKRAAPPKEESESEEEEEMAGVEEESESEEAGDWSGSGSDGGGASSDGLEDDDREEKEEEEEEEEEDGEDGVMVPGVAPVDESDSEDDGGRQPTNRVGAIPVREWYREYDHIGYDLAGKRVGKPADGSYDRGEIDRYLALHGQRDGWRNFYDDAQGKWVRVSDEVIGLVQRLRKGVLPSGSDPTADIPLGVLDDGEMRGFSLDTGTTPKRRFTPSKWEAKRVIKYVRAIREGRMLTLEQRQAKREEERARAAAVYDCWGDADGEAEETARSAAGLAYIPPPKRALPGHAESYNPPEEYLPTPEEEKLARELDPEDRPFLARKYASLRVVPGYAEATREAFERCLDLYLCPRAKKMRVDIDPDSLLPKLPDPRDLRPFPVQTCGVAYEGHRGAGAVRAVAVDPTGTWVATGGDDGTLRLCELLTGREFACWHLRRPTDVLAKNYDGHISSAVNAVAWCPVPGRRLVAAACGPFLFLVPAFPATGAGASPEVLSATLESLGLDDAETMGLLEAAKLEEEDPEFLDKLAKEALVEEGAEEDGATRKRGALAHWSVRRDLTMRTLEAEAPRRALPVVAVRHLAGGGASCVTHVAWHAKGDYVASVNPAGNNAAVVIHRMSVQQSQSPFARTGGRVRQVAFHPIKPHLVVATAHAVRTYDLARRTLVKKLLPGARGGVACISVHAGGDNVLVGAGGGRVSWMDSDLSTRPYRTMRFHAEGASVNAVVFHDGGGRGEASRAHALPLFASASDDGDVHVFHGMVYADLMQNPLIVPVKVLRGIHAPKAGSATAAAAPRKQRKHVTALAWHPRLPWLITAGADGVARLWVD